MPMDNKKGFSSSLAGIYYIKILSKDEPSLYHEIVNCFIVAEK